MKRLFLLFVLLLAGPALAEEPPVCGGNDLLEAVKAKDKAAYEAIKAEAEATPNGEAMLWRIDPPSGAEPSWLLGTAHVTDARIHDVPKETEERLLAANVAVFELAEVADKQRLGMAMMRNARFLAMPIGQTLWDVIPDPDEGAIREHPSLQPDLVKTINAYQPWVVAAMVSIPACEAQRQQYGLQSLDEMLAGRAALQGVPIMGLESVEEQLSILASLSLDDQAKYLVSAAKVAPVIPDYFETLVRFYLERKTTYLMPLAKRLDPSLSDPEALKMMTFFESKLIVERNRRMAERARDYIDAGNAFIAVGALHLPGQEGVVELLRKAGYKVSAVN